RQRTSAPIRQEAFSSQRGSDAAFERSSMTARTLCLVKRLGPLCLLARIDTFCYRAQLARTYSNPASREDRTCTQHHARYETNCGPAYLDQRNHLPSLSRLRKTFTRPAEMDLTLH